MINRIVVATDGSNHAKKAIRYACDLALKYYATVYFLHVIHRAPIPTDAQKFFEARGIEERSIYGSLQEVADRIIEVASTNVALNMSDEARHGGIEIDTKKFW